MKTVWRIAVIVTLATAGVGAAQASPYGHHGHWHGPRVGVGFAFGPVWSPWYYPPPYYPSYTVVERAAPPVYVEQAAPQVGPEAATSYWYFCRAPKAYYPYVKECPGGWERVPPRPEQR